MKYPSILRRYLAAWIDAVLIFAAAYFLLKHLGITDIDSNGSLLVIFIILSYEPIFTSIQCTLGQFLMRYRVRNLEDQSRINILQAYGRLAGKLLLGIISILVIPLDKKRRALHDMMSQTIVVEAKTLTSV